MSTAAIPLSLFYAAPRQPVARWITGSVSVGLAIASAALTTAGHQLSCGASGAVLDVWPGAMLAVLSIATAVAGFACGAADITFGKGDRTVSLLGVAMNLSFGLLFYAVWL